MSKSVFGDGEGNWPLMEPLLPVSPIFDIWETPRVRVEWDSQSGEAVFTVLRTDEVEKRLTEGEGSE